MSDQQIHNLRKRAKQIEAALNINEDNFNRQEYSEFLAWCEALDISNDDIVHVHSLDKSYHEIARTWYTEYSAGRIAIIALHGIIDGSAAKHWKKLNKKDFETWGTFIADENPIGIGWAIPKQLPRVALSIVSGTYNRLAHLQRMIASAENSIPPGLTYEFVIVDGGSTDGTFEWLARKDNVRVIADGRLTGAISAFTRGAYAAAGDFVLLANDDIEFRGGAIMRALGHIASRPRCGAVAFADNRMTQDKTQFKTARLGGVGPDGEQLRYAQVGLFRKWLGDYCDWWGAFTGMKTAKTYGGDNYLSAQIWELGYTVDEVEGVRVNDSVLQDGLRKINTVRKRVKVGERMMHPDSAVYYRQYSDGVKAKEEPQIKHDADRLRILYLPAYVRRPDQKANQYNQKHGLRDGLSGIGMVWEVDYRNIENLDLSRYVEVWQPHLLLMQFHGDDALIPKQLKRAREAKPDMLVINWCGDAQGGKNTGAHTMNVLEHVDLQLTKEASVANIYAERGVRWAYWQQAIESVDKLPDVTQHDAVCLANVYPQGGRREKFLEIERRLDADRINFGRYGEGWAISNGNNHYDYATGEALYKKAKLAISDTYPNTVGFCSNRVMQCMAAGGAVILLEESPGLFKYTGLRAGSHYIKWSSVEELHVLIKEWLSDDKAEARQRLAENAQKHVLARFTGAALVRELFNEILPGVFSDRLEA
jgi:glycosyltransferase involved in cell wall biosynthesis